MFYPIKWIPVSNNIVFGYIRYPTHQLEKYIEWKMTCWYYRAVEIKVTTSDLMPTILEMKKKGNEKDK